jgi:hypothetical protein
MLFIFAMSGFPDRTTIHDSSFYKSIVNIAPQILDLTSSLDTDTFEKLKEMGTPRAVEGGTKGQGIHGSIDSSAAFDKRMQLEKVNEARVTAVK